MVTDNVAKTTQIMRGLGFADTEMGRYVAELREWVAESIGKPDHWKYYQPIFPTPNMNNEERARTMLEIIRFG